MNNRIKELAEQAKNYAYRAVMGGEECQEAYTKKFAELIVRECLDVMSKTSKEANERFTYMGDDVPTVVHQMKIKKHFGVEQ